MFMEPVVRVTRLDGFYHQLRLLRHPSCRCSRLPRLCTLWWAALPSTPPHRLWPKPLILHPRLAIWVSLLHLFPPCWKTLCISPAATGISPACLAPAPSASLSLLPQPACTASPWGSDSGEAQAQGMEQAEVKIRTQEELKASGCVSRCVVNFVNVLYRISFLTSCCYFYIKECFVLL